MTEPLVSAIIVTYNSRADIAACLESLLAVDYPRLEIIVVDNASTDGTADLAAGSFPAVRLIRNPSNLGFGAGNNLGFAVSQGEILVCVNPDVRLQAGALRAFAAAFAADPKLGVAGAKLLFPNGRTLQHAGGVISYPLAAADHMGYGQPDNGQFDAPADVQFVTGAALALRRAAAQATGGYDPGFYPVYYEDVDLCYRARAAGWRVMYLPQAVGIHRTSASLDPASEVYYRFFHQSRLRFVLKHYTSRQVLDDFLPAEAGRLRSGVAPEDRVASHRMYQKMWEETMAEKSADHAPAEQIEELERLVADVEGRWLVREQPFASRLPVLGPLIAAFRAAWNNVATRWYVQPMLQQQVDFNGAVVRAVRALAHAVAAQQTMSLAAPALLADRLRALEDRVAQLEDKQRRGGD